VKLLNYFLVVVVKKCGNDKAAVVEAVEACYGTVCRQSCRLLGGDGKLKQLCFPGFTPSNAVYSGRMKSLNIAIK